MRTKFLYLPILLLATFGMASMLIGQDKDQGNDETVDFKSLKAEYDKAYADFLKAYRAEKDPAKKRELVSTIPSMDDYADQVFEIAKDPESEQSAEALAWLIGGARDADIRNKATKMMVEHHVDSEHMEQVAVSAMRGGFTEESENTMRLIIEKSPHKNIRGKTSYYLFEYLTRLQQTVESGRANSDYLKEKSADSISTEIDELADALAKDYSDVSLRGSMTIGAKMEGVLFERDRLQIGMKVPDIVGEDLDGKEFKLSDYEGKVVVIDFWGDW